MDATKDKCNLEPGKVTSTPSLVLNIGHTMKKLAANCINLAIREYNQDMCIQAKNYLLLHTSELSRRICKYSLDAPVERKAKPLPFIADLQVITYLFMWHSNLNMLHTA